MSYDVLGALPEAPAQYRAPKPRDLFRKQLAMSRIQAQMNDWEEQSRTADELDPLVQQFESRIAEREAQKLGYQSQAERLYAEQLASQPAHFDPQGGVNTPGEASVQGVTGVLGLLGLVDKGVVAQANQYALSQKSARNRQAYQEAVQAQQMAYRTRAAQIDDTLKRIDELASQSDKDLQSIADMKTARYKENAQTQRTRITQDGLTGRAYFSQGEQTKRTAMTGENKLALKGLEKEIADARNAEKRKTDDARLKFEAEKLAETKAYHEATLKLGKQRVAASLERAQIMAGAAATRQQLQQAFERSLYEDGYKLPGGWNTETPEQKQISDEMAHLYDVIQAYQDEWWKDENAPRRDAIGATIKSAYDRIEALKKRHASASASRGGWGKGKSLSRDKSGNPIRPMSGNVG